MKKEAELREGDLDQSTSPPRESVSDVLCGGYMGTCFLTICKTAYVVYMYFIIGKCSNKTANSYDNFYFFSGALYEGDT